MVCIGDPSSHGTSCDPIRTAVACGFTPPPKPQSQKLTKPIHMRRKVSTSSSHCRGANKSRASRMRREHSCSINYGCCIRAWGTIHRLLTSTSSVAVLTTREQQTTYEQSSGRDACGPQGRYCWAILVTWPCSTVIQNGGVALLGK